MYNIQKEQLQKEIVSILREDYVWLALRLSTVFLFILLFIENKWFGFQI